MESTEWMEKMGRMGKMGHQDLLAHLELKATLVIFLLCNIEFNLTPKIKYSQVCPVKMGVMDKLGYQDLSDRLVHLVCKGFKDPQDPKAHLARLVSLSVSKFHG